jgi:hypothetical protein
MIVCEARVVLPQSRTEHLIFSFFADGSEPATGPNPHTEIRDLDNLEEKFVWQHSEIDALLLYNLDPCAHELNYSVKCFAST